MQKRALAVHCHDMVGSPREYLTLTSTVTANYSYYGAGPNSVGLEVVRGYPLLREHLLQGRRLPGWRVSDR